MSTTTSKQELKLIDKHPRSVLSEGRSWGIGYAFAKKEGDKLITVGPISPCKDYLNDQVFSEHTGKPCDAYGYKAKKTGCFDHDRAYLIAAICTNGCSTVDQGTRDATWTKLHNQIQHHPDRIVSFVNEFEKMLGAPMPTTLEKLEENRYLFTISTFWTEGTYLISLLTLLIRVALKYKSGDVMEFLSKVGDGDASYAHTSVDRIKKMVAKGVPKQNLEEMAPGYGVHNMGICGYNF